MDASGVHTAAGPDMVWNVLTNASGTGALVSPLQRVCVPFKHRYWNALEVWLISNPPHPPLLLISIPF